MSELQLMTVPEVAEFLRTTTTSVYAEAERGKIPGRIKIGKRVLFRRDRLVAWVSSCECVQLDSAGFTPKPATLPPRVPSPRKVRR